MTKIKKTRPFDTPVKRLSMASEKLLIKELFLLTKFNEEVSVEKVELYDIHDKKESKITIYEETFVSFVLVFQVRGEAVDLFYSERFIHDNIGMDRYVESMGRYTSSQKIFVYSFKEKYVESGVMHGDTRLMIQLLDGPGNSLAELNFTLKCKRINEEFLRRFEAPTEKSHSVNIDEAEFELARMESLTLDQHQRVSISDSATIASFEMTDDIIEPKSLLEDEYQTNSPQAVDILQQFGFWLNKTGFAKYFGKSMVGSIKTDYGKSPIWILGEEFKFSDLKSVEDSKQNNETPAYVPCLNTCAGFIKRNNAGLSIFSTREVRLTTFNSIDPVISASFVSWLETKLWVIINSSNDLVEASTQNFDLEVINNSYVLMKLVKKQNGVCRLVIDLTVTLTPFSQKTKLTKNKLDKCVAYCKSYFEDCLFYFDWLATQINATNSPNLNNELVLREISHGEMFKKENWSDKFTDPTPATVTAFQNDMDFTTKLSYQGELLVWSHRSGWLLRWFVVDAENIYCFSSEMDMVNIEAINPSPCLYTFPLSKSVLFISNESCYRFDIYCESSFLLLRASDYNEYKKWCRILQSSVKFIGKSTVSSSVNDEQNHPSSTSIVRNTSNRVKGVNALPGYDQIQRSITPLISGPIHPSFPPQIIGKLVEDSHAEVVKKFLVSFSSRFWFTYRKDFPKLTPSIFSSDLGWGCMIRTGQSLLAEAFSRIMLGNGWREFFDDEGIHKNYKSILSWFYDDPNYSSHPYSIHKLASTGTRFNTKIGEWFAPTVLANVLKACTTEHSDCPLSIYVMNNNSIYKEDVLRLFALHNKPVLILFPTRLGAEFFNPCYMEWIKALFRLNNFVGIAGGKPSRSLYFSAIQQEELFFLDPHLLRPICKATDLEIFPNPV